MSDTVNLKKSYSVLNEKLATLFDESGVRRSFTVPYIQGQDTHEHVAAVGQAAQQAGGLTKNLVTTAHHSSGKGWGTGDGHTVGHPGDALRNTIIPKDDEHAKAVVAAAQKHLDNLSFLLGDDNQDVKTANGQLALVKKTDGAGMNLLDFGVMMIQIMYKPSQTVARMHNDTKSTGPGHPKMSLPEAGGQAEPQEGAQPAPAAAGAPPVAQVAPEAPAAPAAAPAVPQAQG